jgi:hypothetical protein
MKILQKQMDCEPREVDDAERLLDALETVTHSTLVAWAETLTAPRMMALLNATRFDDDSEADTAWSERIVAQADLEAMLAHSQSSAARPVELHPNPTTCRALRRVSRPL